MPRARHLRAWGVAVAVLCALGATSGQWDASRDRPSASPHSSAVAALSTASDEAVLPGRVSNEIRTAASAAPLRAFAIAAVVAALFGLGAHLSRTSLTSPGGLAPLRARRHAIALRAPPLQSA
ncbi:MAG: hypothetical protein M3203_05840 [Actinomycetota bacterium]|nr:hypothetical protein [Actinomycetota bacterium]